MSALSYLLVFALGAACGIAALSVWLLAKMLDQLGAPGP